MSETRLLERDRTSDFETGFPFHQAQRAGRWEPDPLILDDQAVVINVVGKGLVVLTGCGHAGVVNIVRYARRLTGVDRVYAVLGGFHLTGPLFEPRIDATCQAFRDLAPEVLIPARCTGWRATQALAARLPEAFIQNSVGTTFELAGGRA
jgi:7,8-dihydropterin-6-yl-methyl-4-(beta-D-ribofuranosyl)aminobenzene 5'-phosphate synthase